MSQFPSMPLFAGDMLADTEHLTNEEFGVYHRLLYAMWRRNGWVPDDDVDLARICHISAYRWPAMKRRMMQFLICEDGELSQKKLLKVREFVEKKSMAQSKNSRQRWHPDSNKNNNMADANAYPNSMHARATPKPKPNPPSGGSARARARPPKERTVNDVLNEMQGKDAGDDEYYTIDASVERRDSGRSADIVQFYALSKDDGS